ncbi:MAG: DUF2283 domain-containing protein [Candidatus Poribacteria bacterium]|nr:DUF2283 domain-containing protein [Candidatus Poribacteria bacterium]
MKCNYHPETDSLFIHFSDEPSADSMDIKDNIVLDFDIKGRLIGIEIFSEASQTIDLQAFQKAGVLNVRQPDASECVSADREAVAD